MLTGKKLAREGASGNLYGRDGEGNEGAIIKTDADFAIVVESSRRGPTRSLSLSLSFSLI